MLVDSLPVRKLELLSVILVDSFLNVSASLKIASDCQLRKLSISRILKIEEVANLVVDTT